MICVLKCNKKASGASLELLTLRKQELSISLCERRYCVEQLAPTVIRRVQASSLLTSAERRVRCESSRNH